MLGTQGSLLARYADLLSLRQQVTAANLANVDTPGYRTRGIDFRSEVARILTEAETANPLPASVFETGGLPVKNDGNDVSLERELRVLAETGIRFSLVASLLRGKIQAARSAIHEGRAG